MENLSVLQQAAQSIITQSGSKPSPPAVVEALLLAEKTAKKSKTHYSFNQLIGDWRLCFITGTKKTRQRAGVVMGAGRYIPGLVSIQLSYSAAPAPSPDNSIQAGNVENIVRFGALQLALSGPAKLLAGKNILAFDFTRISVQLFGRVVYRGSMRGGEAKEREFYEESVSKQAFFSYFIMQDDIIAARGRGGGLALWGRQ